MFTVLGVLLLLASITMLVIYPILPKEDVMGKKRDMYTKQEEEYVKTKKAPDFLLMFTKRVSYLMMGISVLIMLIPSSFFFADRGFNYLLVSPTGKMTAVMKQGIKFMVPGTKIDPWQKYMDVKVTGNGIEIDEDEVEGIMAPVPLRFIDQVTATGYVSLRFELPQTKESFIELAVKYRTMSNLINNTIIPTAKEQLTNTAYMFAAQDYISGDAQSFRQTYEDMLKNGTYAVEKFESSDTIYDELGYGGESIKERKITQINTIYEVNKILLNGIPKRIPHELSENNIIVSQVIVDDVNLEDAFKKRLEAQRDESAKRQLEQQKIKTAKDAQLRILAEGERDKAQEQVDQELAQVSVLIAEETKLKQESTTLALAEIQLKTAKLQADAKKVAADATYYENSKKVKAGLTPQERLAGEIEMNRDKWVEVSKMNLPDYYAPGGGSGKGGTDPLTTLITAAMSKQIVSTKTK